MIDGCSLVLDALGVGEAFDNGYEGKTGNKVNRDADGEVHASFETSAQ